ncbi:MAG: CHASE2 domain-containing protein, partial [Spirulina sp. DLM2.Bin59]
MIRRWLLAQSSQGGVLMASLRRWHPRHWPHLFWVAIRSISCSSLLLMALYIWVERQGFTEPLELVIADYWVAHQPTAEPDPRFLIVTITEADIHRQGWPIGNDQLAEVLKRIQDYQPRVVGLDLYRNLPGTADHPALARQLQAANLIAIEEIVNNIPPPPHVPRDRVGFNDFTLDPDGVIRRLLLFVGGADAEQSYYSFALRVSLAYLGEAAQFDEDQFLDRDRLWINGVPFPRLTPHVGGYQRADTRGYQILFNYHSHEDFAPTISLTSVLAGELTADQVRDRIVLIGSVAPSLKDLFLTPYSRYTETLHLPGVMIHGQGVRQLVAVALGEERLFRFWPHWGESLWLGVWIVVGGAIAWQVRHPLILAGVVVCGGMIIAGTAGLLWQGKLWIPLMTPLLAFAIAVVLAMAQRLLYTTNRDRLTGLANQSSFLSQLTPQRGQGVAKTVIFLELDRFSWIRNSIGEDAGDQVLRQVVSRLQTALPRRALLARLGGDGLAIALPQTDRASLMTLAEDCQATLSRPLYPSPGQPI